MMLLAKNNMKSICAISYCNLYSHYHKCTPKSLWKPQFFVFSHIKLIIYITFQAKNDFISVSVIDVVALKPYAHNTIITHVVVDKGMGHKGATINEVHHWTVSQSVCQLVGLSVSQSICQSVCRSVSQPMSEQVSQLVTVSQFISQWKVIIYSNLI